MGWSDWLFLAAILWFFYLLGNIRDDVRAMRKRHEQLAATLDPDFGELPKAIESIRGGVDEILVSIKRALP